MATIRTEHTTVTLLTADNPGAVAIIQLSGHGVCRALQSLTGRRRWLAGRLYLCGFDEIDEGLAVLVRDDDEQIAQIMPHGGPRVVQRILEKLNELGVKYESQPSSRSLFPEACSDIEADMLLAVARAPSPAAIDLLLAQPAVWRSLVQSITSTDASVFFNDILTCSSQFDRLISPPCIVVVGQPNVGKSTLTNQMLGRSVSVVADLPGTTRDWVGGMVNLSGVAVRWLDTPGIRHSDDAIEQHAIVLARHAIDSADIIIALRDHQIDWPDTAALPRSPDMWCMNKVDVASKGDLVPLGDGRSSTSPLPISATEGTGVDVIQSMILQRLELDQLDTATAWAFSTTLKRIAETGDVNALLKYVNDH